MEDHVHSGHHDHPRPQTRLWRMLSQEKDDLVALLVYTIVTGILALIVPLAAQALVNIIAAGIFLQPLVVLTLGVLGFLIFAGVLRLLQLSLVETLQQRIFARTALTLAQRIPRIRASALAGEYAPELVNRFFDTLTVQKSLSKLLLDGLGAFLQTFVGLILLAFYSPALLGLALIIVLFMPLVFGLLGIGGLRTSIEESVQKYRTAEWLEELARCQTAFKMSIDERGWLFNHADEIVTSYILARRAHFRVLWRQAFANYTFQAVISAATLGIGGWLVINRQLTLGQLVATEIIVISVLTALDKLVKQTEQVYDLLTGLDKVGHITDMPLERTGGYALPEKAEGATVNCRNLHFAYGEGRNVLQNLDLEVPAGARVGLVGASGAGKSTLIALLCGLEEPTHGVVEIDGVSTRDVDLSSLRHAIGLVGDNDEIFDGTIEDNVTAGRDDVTREDARRALETAQLMPDLLELPDGVKTAMVAGGKNFSRGQRQRLLFARAIAGNPRLLIMDEGFIAIDEKTRLMILDAVYAPERNWTILAITHIDEVVIRSEKIMVLSGGKIVESGKPVELAKTPGSQFAALFPYFAKTC